MVIPIERQDEAASAFEDYILSVSIDEKTQFIAVATSREDPEVVVCLIGYRDAEGYKIASTVSYQHITR
jgi:hypothetical protein